MKTTYILKLEDVKNLNRLLKYQVRFIKIKYQNNSCFLYVNENDYQKLIKFFDLYNLSLYKIEGFLKYKNLLNKYFIFIISMIIGILFLYLLTFIVFDIEIMTNKQDLIKIIQNELDAANLKKYQFVKSFNEKEKIKETILNNYKDKFEWIEIDRVGTKYYIHLLERVIHEEDKEINYQNVVAKKNAVIGEIKATSGEVVRKVNDYVNKGDVIISGLITKKDEVKNIVEAKGKIYGETWYNVKVELPTRYQDKRYTGNSYQRLSLNIFNKKIFLSKGKRYIKEEYDDHLIMGSSLVPFSLNNTIIKEIKEDTYFYTYQDAEALGFDLAKKKLLDSLNSDSKIIYQKKLKLYEENSTIIIEVFFKVYEDITDYQKIDIEGE